MTNTAIDTATGVQMADNVDADFIVNNYQAYYGLFIKYMDTALTGSDSLSILALAQLCPERNGTVVYQARALYSFIFNDLSTFNDGSCLDADTNYIADRHSNPNHTPTLSNGLGDAQQYQLFPNPNDGNFVIQQYVDDKQPVSAEIFDVVGRNIHKEKLLFNSKDVKLHMDNIPPGVYLLQLKDSRDRLFRFKFVVE